MPVFAPVTFRRLALVLLGLGLLALNAPASATQEADAAEKQPNILFVLTEDQGAQLSYLGTPGLETPNMDRVAKGGIYFERMYVAYPVCSPSKASIYTGTYCHTNGMIGNTNNFFVPADQLTPGQRNAPVYSRVQVKDRLVTLTEILRDAGYHTAVSGKLHVAPNEKFPYDEWFKPNNFGRTSQMIATAHAADKPFFFFANIQAPHRPFRNSDQIEIGVDLDDVVLPAFLPDTPASRKDWAEYLDYCEVADNQLGEVLRAVDEAGEMENTLIVFMGDHGPAYHRGKMSLYQFGLNVPFAIAGPGIKGGRKTDEMVSSVDVMATLLELLNMPVPAQSQGRSVAGLVRGTDGAEGRANAFAEVIHDGQQHDNGMQERSVFDGRHKLIYRNIIQGQRDVNSDLKFWVLELPDGRRFPWHNRVYDDIVKRKNEYPRAYRLLTEIDPQSFGVTLPKFELYDTQSDPDEFDNLTGTPEVAEVERELKATLRQWAIDTEDRFIDPDEIQ